MQSSDTVGVLVRPSWRVVQKSAAALASWLPAACQAGRKVGQLFHSSMVCSACQLAPNTPQHMDDEVPELLQLSWLIVGGQVAANQDHRQHGWLCKPGLPDCTAFDQLALSGMLPGRAVWVPSLWVLHRQHAAAITTSQTQATPTFGAWLWSHWGPQRDQSRFSCPLHSQPRGRCSASRGRAGSQCGPVIAACVIGGPRGQAMQ